MLLVLLNYLLLTYPFITSAIDNQSKNVHVHVYVHVTFLA